MSDENETDRATPRPWHVNHIGEGVYRREAVFSEDHGQIMELIDAGNGAANAALIVAAVNAHEALVEAASALLAELEPETRRPCDTLIARYWRPVAALRDALALARGEVQPPIACAAALDVQWFSRQPATGEGVEFAARVGGRRYVAYGTYASIDEYAVSHGPTQGDVDMISRLLDEGHDPSTAVEVQL